MTEKEKSLLSQYFYNMEERLTSTLNDCEYRFVRRQLDSVDLLEEIIAKENLKLFRGIVYDISRLLKLRDGDPPSGSVSS